MSTVTSKLNISTPSWLPAAPREGLDPVTLKVTIKNEGGTRISNYVVQWKPDPSADSSRVFTVDQGPLEPGQSRQASLGPYTYKRGSAAPIPGVVLLTNGDDSLTVNIPVKANPTPTPVPVPPSNYFEIKIVTGDRMYAGTDANIYVTLFGSLGTCPEIQATGSFERDDTDYTVVTCPKNVGNIVKIRVRHDDSGTASGWYLADVRVTNRDTGVYWVFHAHRWLATDENDGRIDVEFWPG